MDQLSLILLGETQIGDVPDMDSQVACKGKRIQGINWPEVKVDSQGLRHPFATRLKAPLH